MAVRRREVRWSDAAAEDLWIIVEFIARDGPQAALEILERARRHTRTLAYPQNGAASFPSWTATGSGTTGN